MQLVKQPRRCLQMGESFVQSTTLDVSARFSSLVLKVNMYWLRLSSRKSYFNIDVQATVQ